MALFEKKKNYELSDGKICFTAFSLNPPNAEIEFQPSKNCCI